jgi:glutamate racemase
MIGVFDSGIGGLTVVRALLDLLPDQNITYLGDTARTPYGNKSPQTIIKYALNNTRFLLSQGADIVVIACNTASSYASEAVQKYFQVPIYEAIGPGAQLAVSRSRHLRIGVIGTRATVASGVYEHKILQLQPAAKVYSAVCPLLVPLVEEGWLDKPETAMIVRKYLHPLKTRQIDTLILGCTHYPVLRQVIQRKIGKQVAIVDSAAAIAMQVHAHLPKLPAFERNGFKKGVCRIFVTDTADQFRKTARLILREPIPIEQADL